MKVLQADYLRIMIYALIMSGRYRNRRFQQNQKIASYKTQYDHFFVFKKARLTLSIS